MKLICVEIALRPYVRHLCKVSLEEDGESKELTFGSILLDTLFFIVVNVIHCKASSQVKAPTTAATHSRQ